MSIQQHAPLSRNRHPGAWLACALAVAWLAGCQRVPADDAENAPPPPTPPMAQDTPPPYYPPELACRQVGGQALLDVSLAANGLPVKVTVARSSGVKALDDSAMAAVRDWKFKAATVRGRPASSKLQVPVTFNPPNPPPDECDRYL